MCSRSGKADWKRAGVVWGFWKRDRFTLHNVLAASLIYAWLSCYRYKEDRLVSSAALDRAGWLVITNFERGQKPYVMNMANRVIAAHPEMVAEFHDNNFLTIVIRADRLLSALGETR